MNVTNVKELIRNLYNTYPLLSDESLEEQFKLQYCGLIGYNLELESFKIVLDELRKDGQCLSRNKIEDKFINESSLEFTDISSEEYRIYEFNNGKTVMISEPLKLNVAKSGGHRIYDNSGVSHYIPQGWIHLSWRAKSGQPNFVK